MALWALLAASLVCHQAAAQTEELGPNYIGDEGKPPLPPTAVLNGKVVELDNLGDLIYLNRSSASLNCADGNMQIDVNFKRPFNGIIYANFDRTSPCTWYGDGGTSYHITLPLRGCGTKQGPARVFTNNMIVRFHPHLEWEGDEVVTIVCRYPPPVAAPPVGLLPFVAPTAAAPVAPLQRLGEADIIMIICAILFLALLLLGLGFGYACLKKRRISLIKKVPLEAAPSEGYSQMSAPIFDGLKIPRAHAVPLVDDVTSSETLPSDYPSESPSTAHSEVEEPDAVQAVVAPATVAPPVAAGVPNRAYLMTEELLNTTYTDRTVREEVDIHRQPQLVAPVGPAALTSADDQHQMTSSEHQLTERALVHHAPPPPPPTPPAPVFSSEFRVQQPPLPPPPPSEPDTVASQDVIDTADLALPPPPPPHQPQLTTHTVDDRILSTVTETKVYEDIERRRRAVREYYARQQQPPPPDWQVEIRQHPAVERDFPDTASSHWDDSSVGTEVPPLPGLHAPRVAFDALQPPPPPPTQTVTATDTSSVDRRLLTTNETLLTTHTDVQRRDSSAVLRPPPVLPPPQERPEEPIRPTRRQMTPPRRHPPAMDVLIRVLDAPQEFDDRLSVLTEDERATLRELITSETTFRSMVSEARVRDDWERIRRDRRFSTALPAHKWDVVIRVLAPPLPEPAPSEFSETTRAPSEITDLSDVPEPPPEPRIHRYRSRQPAPAPAPPLPALHETDTRSHVTTRSSYGGDVRSIGEEVVSFHRYAPTDSWSVSDASPPHTQPGTVTSETWASSYGQRPPPEWTTYGERPPAGITTSTTVYHQSQTVSGGVTSTVGDREELYSVAETDVDWQRP